jgi:DNA-binding NarL/FixJ family response regulator
MGRRGRSDQLVDRPVQGVPNALVVNQFEIDGDEYAVFQWSANDPSPQLTPAERAVLTKVVEGASNAEIAQSRRSSVRTVANQVASLLRKLGAGSRFDLIRRFGRSRGADSA